MIGRAIIVVAFLLFAAAALQLGWGIAWTIVAFIAAVLALG